MSIISPTTCGFAKVCVYNIFIATQASNNRKLEVKEQHYDMYIDQFQECVGNFTAPFKTFRLYFPKILDNFKAIQKKRRNDKATILQIFCRENWDKFTTQQKTEHCLFNCKGCLGNVDHKKAMGLFHITAFFKKRGPRK